MSFVSLDFVLLAVAFYPLYSLILYRAPVLSVTLVSLVFYAWINPWYLILIVASALVDYVAALRITSARARGIRRVWLGFSLVANLGILAYFKYWNFFVVEVAGAPDSLLHQYALPLGLSFYTLQTVGYTIDVYKGTTRPERSFPVYLLFVSFFPQLVAGPIERSKRLLPQLRRLGLPDFDDFLAGLTLFLWGAAIKLCVADNLSPFVSAALDGGGAGFLFWGVCLLGMFQVYCDFHGYTLMARGLARGMGVELSRNFRQPFSALTLSGFWRRWHITLTKWIIDYVHLPLVRRFPLEPWRSLSAIGAMVLVGFWHGASWNFIAFGVMHGIGLRLWVVVDRATGILRRPALRERLRNLCLLLFLAASAPLFLVRSLPDALAVLRGMVSLDSGLAALLDVPDRQRLAAGVVLAVMVLWDDALTGRGSRHAVEQVAGRQGMARAGCIVLLMTAITLFANFGGQDFVYFEF